MGGRGCVLKFNNRKGFGLITAISIAFFAVMMGAIVSMLLLHTAYAARRQREITHAYYLVLAGIEIGTAVVLKMDMDDNFPVLDYFAGFTGDFTDKQFVENIIFGPDAPAGQPDLPDFNGSQIEIIIYATYQDGTRITGTRTPGQTVWVEVFARGWYYNATEWAQVQADNTLRKQIGTPHAGTIRFNTQEPEWSIRELANPNAPPNSP